MNITSIELKHTHPSLGPHEEITILTLEVTDKTRNRVEEFIQTSQVNQMTSVEKYLQAALDKDEKLLEEVENNGPKGPLPRGSKVSYLSFDFKGGERIKFSDVYRRYNLSHFYPDFTKFMVAEGKIYRYKAWDGPRSFEGDLPKSMTEGKKKNPEH